MISSVHSQRAYLDCVGDLIQTPQVQSMNAIGQHVPGITCLEHSIFVSYISFLMCRRLGLNYSAAARGGLLHDLYLADWKAQRVGMWKRLVIHPEMAVKNAAEFGLSDLEKDIIRNHMWR
jgi:uncharacterized protein